MENYKEVLHQKSLKASSARLLLLEKLDTPQAHYSAEELFGELKPLLPGLSLGTVYKNLEDMRLAGLLRLVASPNQVKKYEWERGDHLHLVTKDKITDLESPALFQKIKALILEELGETFEIETVDIQIIGQTK